MAKAAQQTEAQPMCPQYWLVFAVCGSDGASYDVWFDDPMERRATCTCHTFKYSDRATCKHIKLVRDHGCFGGGPDDLRRFGVTKRDTPPPKPHNVIETSECCACGQMMQRPDVRLADAAGRQLVRVRFHDGPGAREYTYINGGASLSVGETVTVPDAVSGVANKRTTGTVVGLGSDFAGELTVINTAT
jgi:hypothetical protein